MRKTKESYDDSFTIRGQEEEKEEEKEKRTTT